MLTCASVAPTQITGMKTTTTLLAALIVASTVPACTDTLEPTPGDNPPQLALVWVRDAAEYRAVSLQAYRAASMALPGFVDDKSWSAIPYQAGADELPPAVIMDVDETTVSNVWFQVDFVPPFTNQKLDDWNAANKATPVPGAPEFVQLARDAGVEVFFVTNRPCEPIPGVAHPCPQEATTIEDLAEIGIAVDADKLLLSNERPGWSREKKIRRDLIAEDYRVIMLIGDDLGDFIPCTRRRPLAPCTEGGTIENRRRLTDEFADFWGAGWYVLPNPMHGSWTSVRSREFHVETVE